LGPKIFTREDSWFFKKAHVARTQEFFKKHGPLAIILARFTPIVRTITPIMAGVGSMHYRTFVAYNIVGGFVWAGGLLGLAYAAGTYLPWVTTYIEYVLLAIVALSFIPILKGPVMYAYKKYFSKNI
jgi:membrane-associated protein